MSREFSSELQHTFGQPLQLDALCIAPHPDDAEIGMGGTLVLLAQAEKNVGVLELTAGEMGTLGTPAERLQECAAAAEILGLAWRGCLHLPDGALSVHEAAQVQALAEAFRLLRPRVLFVPHLVDRHPDHVAAHQLCKQAIHLAGLAKAAIAGEPWRPERVLAYQGNADFSPNVFVDVEKALPQWEAAIMAHASQFTGKAVSETVSPDVVERRRARLGYWGTLAKRRYAEAFYSEEALLLPLALL